MIETERKPTRRIFGRAIVAFLLGLGEIPVVYV